LIDLILFTGLQGKWLFFKNIGAIAVDPECSLNVISKIYPKTTKCARGYVEF